MMNDLQKAIVIALAENDMSVKRTAENSNYARTTIQYHMQNIKKQTGLNPRSFFDLIKLYEIATKGEETEDKHDEDR